MDKSRLRATYRSVPVGLSPEVVNGLFTWLSGRLPGTITIYRALPDEVDVWPLVERLPGWRWLLPRIETNESLTWRDARVTLETHRWGIDQPIESAPVVARHDIDHMLVPGLAFDLNGRRLGRGKGFYDREISDLRADAVTIGVTVEDRLVERIPEEGHDERVDYLASESGVRRTSR